MIDETVDDDQLGFVAIVTVRAGIGPVHVLFHHVVAGLHVIGCTNTHRITSQLLQHQYHSNGVARAGWEKSRGPEFHVGIVQLCAKILQIMRNDFKDYARTFCQLCNFSIQISINQERK